jgi:hypothetical protein
MTAYGGLEGVATPYLTSALDGGEWLASRLGRFTPRNSLWYPLNRRLGGPQNRSGRYGLEKNLMPARSRIPAVQPAARLCTDSYPGSLVV